MTEAVQKEIAGPEIEKILGQAIIIPPQPKVLLEIEQLAGQDQVNVKAIANLISRDPGLLAGVFKVVNSPAMGLSRRIDSAESAISVLGIKQLTNVLKGLALRQVLGGRSSAYEKFWGRSGDIAQIAALVAARQVSVCNVFPDQAYMAGLFHDCGLPVLMQRFPGYCESLGESDVWPDLAREDRTFDTDHSVVGYLVSKHWRLPEFIQHGIRFHHEILSVVHPARTVVALLLVSTHIYNRKMKRSDEREWETSWVDALDELGISRDGVHEFVEDVIEDFSAAR